MKLFLITLAAFVANVTASPSQPRPPGICCQSVRGLCPFPGDVQPRDFTFLTPKGYLNKRTGTLSAHPEATCCCRADTSADCPFVC